MTDLSINPIVNFTIYGERCSGTTFLENAITQNFEVPVSWDYGWKYFFGNYAFPSENVETTSTETTTEEQQPANIDNTLFIGIIRNPIHWLNAFSNKRTHVPQINHTLTNFLRNQFFSVDDNNELIKDDINYITKKVYTNIFELRQVKNDYLINIMPKNVKNYVLINYESLIYNYENTLEYIKNKFNLVKKGDKYIKPILDPVSDDPTVEKTKTNTFSKLLINKLWDLLDIDQETQLHYFAGDNNEIFAKIALNQERNRLRLQQQQQLIQQRNQLIDRSKQNY